MNVTFLKVLNSDVSNIAFIFSDGYTTIHMNYALRHLIESITENFFVKVYFYEDDSKKDLFNVAITIENGFEIYSKDYNLSSVFSSLPIKSGFIDDKDFLEYLQSNFSNCSYVFDLIANDIFSFFDSEEVRKNFRIYPVNQL